ncbi:nuclear migration protein-like protein nudF [Microthyrium microscopicum]|uniref:Nuclear distribution protein PAC1 n=1 Tax=Microthyrium microscopicum TaxID=703497 RepID=A0A6A6UUH9_9PEZI|nr:nuclear migration protein-like protein nudF [Microthyrium microscopicum]
MSSLLPRQADELHKSIISYLSINGFPNAAAALRDEKGVAEFDDATKKQYSSLLEKKWTSVVRLQKKVHELEARNASLQNELDSATPTSLRSKNQDPVSWLPHSPARHVLPSHRLPVTCVAFHPLFTSVASGSEDTTIKVWDWELGELERTLKGHTKGVLDIDFGGPRGATLLASCSSDLTIKLWDPSDDYKNIRTLPGHDHSVSSIRFIPSGAAGSPASGNLLVSASRDKTLKIWDVTTGFCVKTIRGHGDWVRAVTPSVDGRWLFSAGKDQTARLWDSTTSEQKAVFVGHEHEILCAALAPPVSYEHFAVLAGMKKPPPMSSTAEFAATAGRDKLIKLWDGRGTLIKTLVGHDNWIRALVFHPGGKYLLSCSEDKTIRCWDLSQEGKCVKTITGAHDHFIADMRWAPSIVREPQTNGANGAATNGVKKDDPGGKTSIRCVLATASIDQNVRIFA